MGAGQSDISRIGLNKGDGLRVIAIRENSPLDGKLHQFFDFIVDVIPSIQSDKTPKQILGKLTDNKTVKQNTKMQSFEEVIRQNADTQITLKIVSTKYRQVYNIQVTPNRKWDGSQDLLGLTLRKQRYDQAFDTYFPFSDIKIGSPVQKAGIAAKQFLIGCLQFKYNSTNQFLENVYDRYYDKQIPDKTINLAVYNMTTDNVRLTPVLLARGWGDKGLLGCQFLQGQLNRFPKNIQQTRQKIVNQQRDKNYESKIKQQLSESSGASHNLVENLKAQRHKKKKHLRNLKNILSIQPPRQVLVQQQQLKNTKNTNTQKLSNENSVKMPNTIRTDTANTTDNNKVESVSQAVFQNMPGSSASNNNDRNIKIVQLLQQRIQYLQHKMDSLTAYIEKISDEDGDEQY